MPAYASLSYSATDNDGKYGLSDDRGQRWAVEFGSVIAPNFLVAVGYTNVVEQTSLDTFTILNSGFAKAAGETATIAEDQDAITARTKYVGDHRYANVNWFRNRYRLRSGHCVRVKN